MNNSIAYLKAFAAVKNSGMFKNINADAIKTAVQMKRAGCAKAATAFSVLAAGIPDRTAIIFNDEQISYKELNARMNKLARGMKSMGLKPGDRMILMCANSSAYVEFTGAVSKLGLSMVPVSTSLKSEELSFIMTNSQSKGIFFSEKCREVVEGAMKISGTMKPEFSIMVGDNTGSGFMSYKDLLKENNGDELIIDTCTIENPVVLYTSGTTGKPKGAVRDPAKVNPLVFLMMMYDFNINRDDILFTPCPLYHAATTAFVPLCLFAGSALVIAEKFDAQEALRLMSKYRATLALMVPTHYNRLTQLTDSEIKKYDLSSLRGMISTGSNFLPALKKQISDKFGDKIYDLYGGTEVGMTMLAKPEDVKKYPDSIGKPMTGVDVILADANGKRANTDEQGELYVKSLAVFNGYYKNEKATNDITLKGYYSIGDIAKKNSEGYYFICDRKNDMIISGGVNIYPREIENTLLNHKDIEDAAVIGAPSNEWGEIVIAFVKLRENGKLTPNEIQQYTGEHLAGYKKPKAVFILPELPRNPQGKLLKKELKVRYEAGEFK